MSAKDNKIHYVDRLEESIGETLNEVNIPFIHESQRRKPVLDFHLTEEDVYIEVKYMYSERSIKQMESKQHAILVQGKKAVDFFNKLLANYNK